MPIVELEPIKISKIDADTMRYWFSFKKRPQKAFVLYLNLLDNVGNEYQKRCEVKSLTPAQFKEFDKEKATYGSFYVDEYVKSVTTPCTRFKFRYVLNVFGKKDLSWTEGNLPQQIEDLTDPKLFAQYLQMIHDQLHNKE